MSRQYNKYLTYPLYNICYKMKDGQDKVVSQEVTLKQGIIAMKKFDQVLVNGSKELVKDVLYCYLLPLLDKKPHFDAERGEFVY